MYRRILLAYDGSVEGRTALREGALLAKACGAQIYILSVVSVGGGMLMAESVQAGLVGHQTDRHQEILDEAVAKLTVLGLAPVARLVQDEPARAISAFAHEVQADLVVVGHRRQSVAERWWSGRSGAYLIDHLGCSVLVARNRVDDGELLAGFAATT